MIITSNLKKYSILFEDNFDIFSELSTMPNTIFAIDKNIYALYNSTILRDIDAKKIFLIDATESEKTVETVLNLCDKFTEISAKRNATLISIGGGIIQDVTGFTANILYRGINWIYFPTTLLASADSCIGGKTSLNYKKYKNLLGTFYPPDRIIICSQFLKTLNDVDYKSGLGEVIKFNVMAGDAGLKNIEDNIDIILARNYEVLNKFVLSSLEFKKQYIEKDEFDKSERILLNFAHTFAHAFETASRYKIPHGSAVAMGMLVANFISVKRNLLKDTFAKRVIAVCNKVLTLPLLKDWFNYDVILNAMQKDKKQISSSITVILLHDDAILKVHNDLSEEELKYALDFLIATLSIK